MTYTSPARLRLAVPLIVTALVALVAMMAPKAEATEFTPVDDPIEVTNTTPTDFVPGNASSAAGLRCNSATTGFTVEDGATADNINRTGVGVYSTDSGSIATDLSLNDQDPAARAPVFDNCVVWNFATGTAIVPGVTVTTSDTNGWWSVAADAITEEEENDVVGIGVPKAGAIISLPAPFSCDITVSPDQSSVVMADFYDGDEENAATLEVDGQIKFDGCGLPSPSQFEGDFEVTSQSGDPVVIDY